MNSKKTIILASQSRDRKRLLSDAGVPHVVIVSKYEEKPQPMLSPTDLAAYHAQGKAKSVQAMIDSGVEELKTDHYIIIAADTIVNFNGEILGKAVDKAHAMKMLMKLMGNTHTLITAVVIYDSETNSTVKRTIGTLVEFASLSKDEIENYLTYSDEYKWRAGSYSMFDRASMFIETISGSPSNVIGLPMDVIYQQLKCFGINLLKMKNDSAK